MRTHGGTLVGGSGRGRLEEWRTHRGVPRRGDSACADRDGLPLQVGAPPRGALRPAGPRTRRHWRRPPRWGGRHRSLLSGRGKVRRFLGAFLEPMGLRGWMGDRRRSRWCGGPGRRGRTSTLLRDSHRGQLASHEGGASRADRVADRVEPRHLRAENRVGARSRPSPYVLPCFLCFFFLLLLPGDLDGAALRLGSLRQPHSEDSGIELRLNRIGLD